jgi:large conductance mechanosensitive channel
MRAESGFTLRCGWPYQVGLFQQGDAEMGLLSEFKKFAMRGNVVDMAVGIVIGASFGKIVGALVDKIIMPVVGFLTGGINLADRTVTLSVLDLAPGKSPQLGWGAFVQAVVDFVIVAFALFLVVKGMNAMRTKEESAPATPPEEIVLLREIRDSLAKS